MTVEANHNCFSPKGSVAVSVGDVTIYILEGLLWTSSGHPSMIEAHEMHSWGISSRLFLPVF